MFFNNLCFFFFAFFQGSVISLKNSKPIIYTSNGTRLENIEEHVNGTIEFTCEVSESRDGSPRNITWRLPNLYRLPDQEITKNSIKLTLTKLNESDSGEYICDAITHSSGVVQSDSVHLTVKQASTKQKSCASTFFECAPSLCIPLRFVCDGHIDCTASGRDEDPNLCGEDPCEDKILCPEGRCIPSSWCCHPGMPNCSSVQRPDCCPALPRDGYMYLPPSKGGGFDQSTLTFLQTSLCTIAGFVIISLSVVSAVMMAVWRVQAVSAPRCRRRRLSALGGATLAPLCPSLTAHRTLTSPSHHVVGMLYDGVCVGGAYCSPPPYSHLPPPPYPSVPPHYMDRPPPYQPHLYTQNEDSETSPCLQT